MNHSPRSFRFPVGSAVVCRATGAIGTVAGNLRVLWSRADLVTVRWHDDASTRTLPDSDLATAGAAANITYLPTRQSAPVQS